MVTTIALKAGGLVTASKRDDRVFLTVDAGLKNRLVVSVELNPSEVATLADDLLRRLTPEQLKILADAFYRRLLTAGNPAEKGGPPPA